LHINFRVLACHAVKLVVHPEAAFAAPEERIRKQDCGDGKQFIE
jgi:hypothetical protein